MPFFHLYESIYKFRHSITNLLEQNKFISLADRLDMIQQLSSIDDSGTNDFVENSERVLKDTVKVLQTCMTTLMSTAHESEAKAKAVPVEPAKASTPPTSRDSEQAAVLQQKESAMIDLNNQYQQLNRSFDETNKKHEENLAYVTELVAREREIE